METWNWEGDDRLILTKSFKYPVIGLCFLGEFCLLLGVFYKCGDIKKLG